MGLFDRLSRVVRANLNDLVSKAEDPEKVLEQTINDIGEDLIQVRQAVARAIAEQKRTEQRYNQDISEANKWEQRAKLALSKGDESLAREALVRKKTHTDTSVTLKQQLEQQNGQVNILKRNLVALESKISEAKTKKNMLIARSKAAKANVEIQQTLSDVNTSGSMAAFERMESKVLEMEARSQAIGELGDTGLEEQFARLESGSGVDEELAMLKAQISGISEPQKLPEASNTQSYRKDLAVDAELEDLRKKLDNL
ncbi:PspA/IM30 family protein [cyanobacterium endosymbiont of Epithemia turgida]|uniref:PspA/IM30 family protein n=1 Tax=cyanobacterium endosymbiont of Epithemia turgida TaxID=718217 RepID=UPI0004D19F5B|nr:PspA/IM30 family protein [cyanobacterium endosymbiont of Epithemia turgida]BAP17848.1 putative PspA/IM30 [cyanobacterium endosymbiont of Epithemia turgida isolate EtSB Lake Yunoko]